MILSKNISVFGTVGDTCTSMHCSSVIGARGYSNVWKNTIKQIVGWPGDMSEGMAQEFMYNIFDTMDSEILMDPICLFNELKKHINIDAVTLMVLGQGSMTKMFIYNVHVRNPDTGKMSWVVKVQIIKHDSSQAPYSHILDSWGRKCDMDDSKYFPSKLARHYAYINKNSI